MNPSTREDFHWLVSDPAAPVLETVQAAFEENVNVVSIAKSLRKKFTETRAALIMEQAQLRIRADRKFKRSKQMFFTKRGLEQASGRRIAQYKAERFRNLWNVADVCCGIGGDLLSLATRRSDQEAEQAIESRSPLTVGIDNDPLTVLFARKNLEVNEIPADVATVEEREFSEVNLEAYDGFHFDPDRRVKGRTVVGNNFAPPLEQIFDRVDPNCCLAIKVAPATPPQKRFGTDVEREWIGDHRECKQQVLWRGPFTRNPGHRTATYVGKRGVSSITVHESELTGPEGYVDELKRFVFEPHPSVLASKLTDLLARKHGLSRFCEGIVYLTGDEAISEPLLTQFEVLDIVRMDVRSASKTLKVLEVGEIEVKKRGIERLTQKQFMKMKLEGPNKATILLTRMGKFRVAIIAKRKGNPLTMPGKS